jgi:hypothetical protein
MMFASACAPRQRHANDHIPGVGVVEAGDTLTRNPLSDVPSCRQCRISISPIAEIGSVEDTVVPVVLADVAEGMDQHFYVGPVSEPSKVAEFGWDGSLIRLIGHRGKGPGELTGIGHVVATSDSLIGAFSINRIVWFPLSGQPPITETVAQPLDDARLVGLAGRRVVGSNRSSNLRTFVAYGPDGRGRTFGDTNGFDPAGPRTFRSGMGSRWLADAGSGIWTVSEYFAPIFEQWSFDGHRTRRLRLPASWFTPYGPDQLNKLAQFGIRSVPIATTKSAWRSRDGYLWTITQVPDRKWRFSLDSATTPPGLTRTGRPIRSFYGFDRDLVLDAVLAVYSVTDSTATLIASQQVDQALTQFLSDSVIAQETYPDGLSSTIRLFRFRLIHPPH